MNEGKTILVVDDDIDILDSTSQILNKLGYQVLSASCGTVALDILKENREVVDMVILDMLMPEMSGSDLYPRLKNINPDLRVLVSTGYNRNEQIQQLLDGGRNGFIQKPYNLSQLIEKVRKTLYS